jgi:hypothetical protein
VGAVDPRRLIAAGVAAVVVAAGGCGGDAAAPSVGTTAAAAPADDGAGLRGGPFAPADRDLFGPPYYPDARDLPPAPGPARGAEELLEDAVTLVAARGSDLSEEARALFAAPELRARIPNPALRAAAVSLLGTIAEPALDWLVDGGGFASVGFGAVEGSVIAKSLAVPDGLQRIVVADRLRFERPGLLSVVLAHEALHADPEPSDLEELVATALQAIVHMQQLLADPSLAAERTELAQSANAWVLIRLNTREAGTGELRLVLDDDGPSVLPGGLDRPYFAAFFDPSAPETPGNAYLADLLAAVAGETVEPPARPGFDLATVEFLDENQAVLGERDLARVAQLLDLEAPSGA